MRKTKQIEIRGRHITLLQENGFEYVNLTHLLTPSLGKTPIHKWMSHRETLIYMGLWESLHNTLFDSLAFNKLKQQTGLKNFSLTPEKWLSKTNGVGIFQKSGRYKGIYAQWDLALEFAEAVSPMLKLLLSKERNLLKEVEMDPYKMEWNMNRKLAKTNNRLHNSVIRQHLSPVSDLEEDEEAISYRSEANLINLALFNLTAEEWRESNPELVRKGLNIRDLASINELLVLANLETVNAVLIQRGVSRAERLIELNDLAEKQLGSLNGIHALKSLKRITHLRPLSPAA